jgi:predicted DNA-binding transcriptional regulator YafY
MLKMSTKLERLFYIDAVIHDGSYPSVKTFMERFEVSERTILNDIQFLKDRLNAPIQYSRTERGYFYTDSSWRLSTFPVTEGDLLAFFLSVELAHRYLGTPFEKPLRDSMQRLSNILPDKVQISISELSSHYSVRAGATAETNPETLITLQKAIQDQHPVNMVYFTAQRGQETERIVHPYHLFNMHGEWYLIAFDRFRQGVRQFALPRIRSLHLLTEETFEIDSTFSPEYYFRKSFQSEHGENIVEVILLFDAYQSRYIRERAYHSSQQLEEQPDGSVIMRFNTGAIGEVQRWIMSYGSHVRVLSPKSLAESIISEFSAGLQQYNDSQ